MADRFPLILNTSTNQIQEIPSGDILDLTGSGIANAGIITATSFSGPIVAGAGVSNITSGIGTFTDLRVGGDTSFSEDLVVTGNARVTGILTVGTSSIILNDSANTIKVGTALTLGHTQGLQFHTQNLHSAGFEVNQINVSGASTIGGNLDANGDLDVDGHTNLDNVSISGVTTISGAAPNLLFTETDANPDWGILCSAGQMKFQDTTASANIFTLDSNKIQAVVNLDALAGIDVTGNLIASGNLTANNGTITVSGTAPKITFTETNDNPDYKLEANGGNIAFVDTTNSATRLSISSAGINVTGNGVFSGNVSIGGTLTYEDVTNIDSIGIITARNGVDVTGTITADGARFTDDGSSSPTVSIFTDDANPYALNIGNSSYNASSPFGLNFFNNNSGEGYFRHIGNGAYKDYHFSLHDNSNNKLCIKLEGDDQSVELYGRGTKDLETTGTGVVVTGVCTATTFVGALTGTASGNATISSNADNRIITGGSGNALTGESELTYSTYLNLTRSANDTNFGDNSAPGGVNGIFISNSQSTNGVFSAITLSANDVNGTNQSGSLVAKSVSGGYVPEVHISQRTANNTNESNFKINSNRGVEVRYQGNNRLETTSTGVTITGAARINYTSDPVLVLNSTNTQGAHIRFLYDGTEHHYVGAGDGFTPSADREDFAIRYKDRFFFSRNGTNVALFDSSNHFVPATTNTHDLGLSTHRWRNIYTNDLNLSNEGGKNEVDGTWGNYTIQEGESDLFLINKRSGKKYKFNLTEVN